MEQQGSDRRAEGPAGWGAWWPPSLSMAASFPSTDGRSSGSCRLPTSGKPPQRLNLTASGKKLPRRHPAKTETWTSPNTPQHPLNLLGTHSPPGAFTPELLSFSVVSQGPPFPVSFPAGPQQGGGSWVVCREDGKGWGCDGMMGTLSPSPALYLWTLLQIKTAFRLPTD